MTTVKFSATPTTLIETQGTAIVFRFELDQVPPAGGIKVTLKGNVPQSLTQLDLFALTFTGGEQPVGDFDFSGFDFTITAKVATVRVPIFQDNQAEGLQTVTYTLQPGTGYTVAASAKTAVVNFVDNPSQVPSGGGKGTAGADTLTGTARKDTLDGLGGNDRISGLGGGDILVGNGGNDILLGGVGTDSLTGGRGRDSFALERGLGTDKVLDFKNGQDKLGLPAGLTFRQISFTQKGDNLLVRSGNDALATLTGITRNQITQADFTTIT